MLIHDWTNVTPGVFHDFHLSWIVYLARALNAGGLPSDYYALIEQVAGESDPDPVSVTSKPSQPTTPGRRALSPSAIHPITESWGDDRDRLARQ